MAINKSFIGPLLSIIGLNLCVFSLGLSLASFGSEPKEDNEKFFGSSQKEVIESVLLEKSQLTPESVTVISSGTLLKENEGVPHTYNRLYYDNKVLYWVVQCKFKEAASEKTYDRYYMIVATFAMQTAGGSGTSIEVVELPSFLKDLIK